MPTTDAAPDPSRMADPERVSPPVAVSPFAVDAPIVRTPAAWMIPPPTAKSKTPMATVPDHPVVLSEDIAAFRSTVTVPPPEFASKNTGLEAFGTEQPFTPPDEEDQCVVCDQLPGPPIREHAARRQVRRAGVRHREAHDEDSPVDDASSPNLGEGVEGEVLPRLRQDGSIVHGQSPRRRHRRGGGDRTADGEIVEHLA